jgi:ribosomal protein L30E
MIHIIFRLYWWYYVISGGNLRTLLVKEKAETLVVASKKIGKDVNADRTKYMIISREQNAGLSRTIKIYSSPNESVDVLKYFGTSLTCQSSIEEVIKSRLISGIAC